jgi:hypothetical protein
MVGSSKYSYIILSENNLEFCREDPICLYTLKSLVKLSPGNFNWNITCIYAA